MEMDDIKKKPTNELINELVKAGSLCKFMDKNCGNFIESNVSDALCELIDRKGLSKSAVLKKAEINDIYGYQFFSGKRRPSRDKLIELCIGMELSLDEVQSLLKESGFPALYPKFKRDSIIINCICEKKSVVETNDLLFDYGENLLS